MAEVPVQIVSDYEAMSDAAAKLVIEAVRTTPGLVLALPTGGTPLGLFRRLVAAVDEGRLDLSRTTFFCLDEYVGAAPDDPNSLTGWLLREFMHPAGIRSDQIHVVPATADDLGAAAVQYEAALAEAGGLDLAVLGLGPNGHIAFNEPGAERDSRTRVLALTPESIAQSAAYWASGTEVATTAITMGIGTLLEAKRIVLIVSGAAKASILRRALKEAPSAAVPASWLQTVADKTLVIADEAAAGEL